MVESRGKTLSLLFMAVSAALSVWRLRHVPSACQSRPAATAILPRATATAAAARNRRHRSAAAAPHAPSSDAPRSPSPPNADSLLSFKYLIWGDVEGVHGGDGARLADFVLRFRAGVDPADAARSRPADATAQAVLDRLAANGVAVRRIKGGLTGGDNADAGDGSAGAEAGTAKSKGGKGSKKPKAAYTLLASFDTLLRQVRHAALPPVADAPLPLTRHSNTLRQADKHITLTLTLTLTLTGGQAKAAAADQIWGLAGVCAAGESCHVTATSRHVTDTRGGSAAGSRRVRRCRLGGDLLHVWGEARAAKGASHGRPARCVRADWAPHQPYDICRPAIICRVRSLTSRSL